MNPLLQFEDFADELEERFINNNSLYSKSNCDVCHKETGVLIRGLCESCYGIICCKNQKKKK